MKKTLSLIMALLLIFTLFAGCSTNKTETDNSTTTEISDTTTTDDNTTASGETDTIVFTDDCGRTVEIEGPITKIVPSGPLSQIMLFAIVPDMFVGVSSDWDEAAATYLDEEYYNLPIIGQLYGGKGDVNYEELLILSPQILIDVGEAKGSAGEDLDALQEQLGIPCIHIEATLYTMPDAYRKIGKLLNRETEAEEIAQYYESWLAKTEALITEIGEENLANVIYCVGLEGLSVLAKTSFHAEIIDMLTNNVAVVEDVSSKGTGNPVDMEQLLLWNPDYIIFSPDGGYEKAENDETWHQLKAISSGNYIEVPYGPYNWMTNPPSVQRILSLIWLPVALYPEYIDYDVYEETAKYFEMFYHCDLTKEQFDILTENAFFK